MSDDTKKQEPLPPQWRVISISLYPKDLDAFDELVAKLKARGVRNVNRSSLIRHWIDTFDPDKVKLTRL